MNTLPIFSPIGSILVGIILIWIWKHKTHVNLKYFAFGGLTWFGAIILKLMIDAAVGPALNTWSAATYGFNGMLIVQGLYLGFRTGTFDCGFTYLALSRSNLRKMSHDEATAFGVGFGSFEAIFIAIPYLLQLATFLANPSLLDSLPTAQSQALESQLNLPTWIVLATINERIFTFLVHVFVSLLVFMSVFKRKLGFLVGAVVYKILLDVPAPNFQANFSISEPLSILPSQIWVVCQGITALAGTLLARKKLRIYQEQKLTRTKRSVAVS